MNINKDGEALQSLENRINNLQKLVYSNLSQGGHKKPLEVLEQSRCTLKELEKRHAVLNNLWKKLPQLDEYLTTEFLQKIGINDEVKTNLILANEDNLQNLSKHIEELKSLQNVVNNNSLKDVPLHSSKLEAVIQVHMDQRKETDEVCERIDQLLTAYTNVTSTLSKQFMLWNNLVTQCELAVDMEREFIE